MDISAKELKEKLAKPGETTPIIDVREEMEYHGHNIGGLNIPLAKLQHALDGLNHIKTDELVVVCLHGRRSSTARHILTQNGFTNVRNLTGGLAELHKLNSAG